MGTGWSSPFILFHDHSLTLRHHSSHDVCPLSPPPSSFASSPQAESATDDLKSRLVCLDGAVHDLSSDLGAGEGVGKLTTRALGGNETGLAVWA